MTTGGFTSSVLMSIVAFGSMIGFNELDLAKSFTMIYLFTFVQTSLGMFPALMMNFTDGLVSLKRIGAFLRLPEID